MERSRWISDLHWVRPGQQRRSQRTQEALLDAAEVLFGENGVEYTSVADIAERAGCSVGAVYHHFSDKKAVLYALFDRVMEELDATTRDAVDPGRWEGAAIGEIVRGWMEFSLRTAQDRPGFKRACVEAARYDPALAEQYTKQRMALDVGLTELMLARRDEIGHPEPERAVRFVLEQLGCMLRSRGTETPVSTRFGDESDGAFMGEALRSVCGYLRIELPEGVAP